MINENDIKQTLSENLIFYRKENKLTQIQLAEKLNYSDKAISKWERGESVPDLFILVNIAEIYGITVNDLISERKVKPVLLKDKKIVHCLIVLLAILLVWLIATMVFVGLRLFLSDFKQAWLSFIFAIPASMIVLIIFSYLWGNYLYKFLTISALCWSIPLCLTLSIDYDKMWLLYLCVIPLQFLVIFFLLLRKKMKK